MARVALGSGVVVTYAADWSEYHSVNGYYHLDPLWISPNIDVVCIDNYLPVTPDLP
jgi:type IV secretory pathway ATPase VirB11/archaellum biosynthesis ATPase